MRAALGWLGLRNRWSTLDSSGVGVTGVSPVVAPVIVVGSDSDDTHSYNWGSLAAGPLAGFMVQVMFVPSQDHWVEEVQVFEVVPANQDIYLRVEPDTLHFPTVTTGILFPGYGAEITLTSTVTPPTGARFPLQKGGGAPNGSIRWAPPGILIPVGQRLTVQSDTNNAAFVAGFNCRNA